MVLPGCLGFSTWYVQGEYSNDIFTFIKVPVITGTFLKWSADSKSEKKMKPVLSPISSRTEGKEEAVKFKMITFKAVRYLVYSRRHLKNTRTVFQKEGKTWSDEFLLTRSWPKSCPCSIGSIGTLTGMHLCKTIRLPFCAKQILTQITPY